MGGWFSDSITKYSLKQETYKHNFPVHNFNYGIKKGQYKFPFSLLLPSMMTGSFQISNSNYLRYTLIAKAEASYPSQQIFYQNKLTILERLRGIIGPESICKPLINQAQCCCSCCCDYGSVKLKLEASKNYVRSGQMIKLKILIDNARGQRDVEQIYIEWEERMCQTISADRKYESLMAKAVLIHLDRLISQGQKSEFELHCKIPLTRKYTAIGRLIGRYFLIRLMIKSGCCSVPQSVCIHLVLDSPNPEIIENLRIMRPQEWKPVQFPEAQCMDMPPYKYRPLPSIPFMNLPKQPHIVQIISKGYAHSFSEPMKIYNYLKDYKTLSMGTPPLILNSENSADLEQELTQKLIEKYSTKTCQPSWKNQEMEQWLNHF